MNELFIVALISYLFAAACASASFYAAWRSRKAISCEYRIYYSYRASCHRSESYLFLLLVFATWIVFVIAGVSAP